MGDERTPRRIFVGGLFQGISDQDLQDRFSRFGDVTGIDVRARKDDEGNILKTFAYLNMAISDKDYKKCMATFNKTKWRGNEMQIQIAKESFVDRLKREQEAARSNTGPKKKPMAEPVNLSVKGAVPGTAVEGKPDWVVAKYGVVLPVVNLRTKNKKKVITVDPSKYVHAVKKFEHGKRTADTNKEDEASINGLTWSIEVEEKEILKKIKGEFPPSATKRKSPSAKKLTESVTSEITATSPADNGASGYHSNTSSCDSDDERTPKKKKAKQASVAKTKDKDLTSEKKDLSVGKSPAKRKRTISDTSTPSGGKDKRGGVVSPNVSIIEGHVNGSPTKPSVTNATAILEQIRLASKKKRKLSSSLAEKSPAQGRQSEVPVESVETKEIKKVSVSKGLNTSKNKKAKLQEDVSSESSSSEDEKVSNTSKTMNMSGAKSLKMNKSPKITQQESSDDSTSSADSEPQQRPEKKTKAVLKSPAAKVTKNTEKGPTPKAKKTKTKSTPNTSKIIQIQFDADIGVGSDDNDSQNRTPKSGQNTAATRKAQMRPSAMPQQPKFAQVPLVDEFGIGAIVDDKSSGITSEEKKWNKYNRGGYSSDEDILDAVSQGRAAKLDRIAKTATIRSKFIETPPMVYPEAGEKSFTPQKVYNSDTEDEDERFQTVQTQPKRTKVKQPPSKSHNVSTSLQPQGDSELKKNRTSGYAANSESEISYKEKAKQKKTKKLSDKKLVAKKETDDSSSDEEELSQQSKTKPKSKQAKKTVNGKPKKSSDSSSSSESDSDSESESSSESEMETMEKPGKAVQSNKPNVSKQKESSESTHSDSSDSEESDEKEKPVTVQVKNTEKSKKSKQEESSDSESSETESDDQVQKPVAVKPQINNNESKQKDSTDSSESESSDSGSEKGIQKVKDTKLQSTPKRSVKPKETESSESSDSSDSESEETVQKTPKLKIDNTPNDPKRTEKIRELETQLQSIKKLLKTMKPEESGSDSSESASEVTNKKTPAKAATTVTTSKSPLSKQKENTTKLEESSSESDSTDSSSSSASEVTNKKTPAKAATTVTTSKPLPSGQKEKNPPKPAAPTPPAKTKVAPAVQSKMSLDANQKRLESLKQRSHEAHVQKNLLKNALASVDSQPSKKIVFDSDDEDEKMQSSSERTPTTNGGKKRANVAQSSSDSSDSESSDDSSERKTKSKEAAKKAPTLFADSADSSSEEEDADDRFRVRPQFEGKAGSRLISLQSRFGNDSRFKITEKFLDNDKEKDSSEDSSDEEEEMEEENIDNNDSASAERDRAMAILKDVVGDGAVKGNRKNKPVTFKDMTNRHYDPTKDEHKQFEIQVETKKKEKKKKKKEVEEEAPAESAPLPEVSGEKFFQVETSLKDMFNKEKSDEQQPFSLLAMMGRDNEETNDNTRKVQEDGKGSVLQQIKSPWQQQFGSDDSDDDDRGSEADTARNFPDVTMAETPKEAPRPKVVSHGFFFVENDPRIADGVDFFHRQEDLDVVRRRWAEARPELVEAYRAKRRRFRFMKKDANTSSSPHRGAFRGRGRGVGRGRGGRR